jgi:hypothetical protein
VSRYAKPTVIEEAGGGAVDGGREWGAGECWAGAHAIKERRAVVIKETFTGFAVVVAHHAGRVTGTTPAKGRSEFGVSWMRW